MKIMNQTAAFKKMIVNKNKAVEINPKLDAATKAELEKTMYND